MTDKEFSNLPIGRTFILGNTTLKVVEDYKSVWCEDCYFNDCEDCHFLRSEAIIPNCGNIRTDKKLVHFEKVK